MAKWMYSRQFERALLEALELENEKGIYRIDIICQISKPVTVLIHKYLDVPKPETLTNIISDNKDSILTLELKD